MVTLSSLEISVGVLPSSSDTFSLKPELELIKPALLYGDTTSLYSPHILILEHLDRQVSMTGEELFANLQSYKLGRPLTEEERSMTNFLNHIQSLRDKPNKTRNDQLLLMALSDYKDTIQEAHRKDITPQLDKFLRDTGYKQIRKAIKSGLLTVTRMLDDQNLVNYDRGDALVRAYFRHIEQIMADPRSYPIFDEFSTDVVRALVADGKLPASVLSAPHAAQTGIASQLIRATPTFPKADVYDILDIRKELKKPLVKFRQYVVELGELTQAPVFGPEFEAAVQDLIISKIDPALAEIEEAIQSNKPLKKLIRQSVGSTGAFVRNALLLGLSQVSHLGLFIGGAAAAAQATASTTSDVLTTQKQTEQQKVYFLHALEAGLEKRYK